jgi:HSP20 family protein
MRVRHESVHYRFASGGGASWTRAPGRLVPAAWGRGRGAWVPPCDVYETADAVVVLVELAGVDEEGLQVTLFADAVVVQGRREAAARESGVVYHAAEIGVGPFVAEVALPRPVSASAAQLRYDRGLLHVILPKRTGEG